MTTSDAEKFVARFAEIWENPDPERYAELWHENGSLVHPTMSEPLAQDGIPDYVRRLQTAVPDISLSVDSWAANEDGVVLIEWTLSGSAGDQSTEIKGVDRFTLSGDKATEGVAYFDTMPLWAQVDPDLAQNESLEDRLQRMTAAAE